MTDINNKLEQRGCSEIAVRKKKPTSNLSNSGYLDIRWFPLPLRFQRTHSQFSRQYKEGLQTRQRIFFTSKRHPAHLGLKPRTVLLMQQLVYAVTTEYLKCGQFKMRCTLSTEYTLDFKDLVKKRVKYLNTFAYLYLTIS